MFQVRVGDLGAGWGRGTAMASWGRSLWKLAGQSRGASQRWEEAGRRKLGPGDHRAASWPGSRIGGAGKSLGSRPTAGPWRGRGVRAALASALGKRHLLRPQTGGEGQSELRPGAPPTEDCRLQREETWSPEPGPLLHLRAILPLPGFTLGGAQSTMIAPIPQAQREAECWQPSSQFWNCGDQQQSQSAELNHSAGVWLRW